MKRILNILLFTLLANIALAQKPDYQQTRTSQVLSEYSKRFTKSLTIPAGPTPGFASYVADTSKCGSLFLKTGGARDTLMVYSCATGTWVDLANDNAVVHRAGDTMPGSLINNESVSVGAIGYTQTGISPNVAAHQGVADDGTYYYIVATTSIKKYDHSWNLIATRSDPFTRNTGMVHLGPPYVQGGKLYTNLEDQNGYDLKPTGVQEVWTYNTSDLTDDATITNSKFSELQVGAALCINADTLYMAAFATDVVARFKLSTNTFINSFHTGVLGMQGIRVLPDGHLIVSSASGFFRMNRTDGSNLSMVKAIKPGDGVVEGIEIQGSNLLYLRDVSNNGTESYVVTLSPTSTPQAFYTDKTGATNVGGNLQVGGYGLFLNPLGILTQNYKGAVNASSGNYNKINLEHNGSKAATGISSNGDRAGLVYNYHSMFASNDIVDDSTKYAAQVRIENDNKRFGFFSGLTAASNATTPRFTVAFDTGLATLYGNLIPTTNNTLSVGSSTNYFNNGYFTASNIKTLNSNDLEVTPAATIRAMRFTTTEGTNWDFIPTTLGNGAGTDKLIISASASTTSGANFTISKTNNGIGLYGIYNPTSFLHIPGGTTSMASIRVIPGVAPTSPNSGDLWNTGPTWKTYTSNNVIRRFAAYPDVTPLAGRILVSNGTDFDLTSSPTLIQSSANSMLNLTNNTQTNTWSIYSTGGFNAAGSGRYSISNTGSPSTASFTIDSVGRIGAYSVTSPTSYFDFPGATTSYGSLRIRTMSARPTSPNEGAVVNTGANLELYLNSNWNKLVMTQETTPNPGQMLMYNTNTNRYDPITPAGNSGINLVYGTNGTGLTIKIDTAVIQNVSNLFPRTDTRYQKKFTLSGLATNDILQYNGTNWQNAANTYSAPLVHSGGNTSITKATTSADGYLSATDWNTFNGKASLTSGNTWTANQTFTSSILAKSTVNFYDTGGTNAVSVLAPTTLTTSQAITLPDASGTVALTSDIAAANANPYATSATPSIVVDATHAGSGYTISIAGTNQDGVITLTTGSAPSGVGGFSTITMSGGFAYPNSCVPVLMPANSTALGLVGHISTPSSSTTSFDISTDQALTGSTIYKWNYHNGGY